MKKRMVNCNITPIIALKHHRNTSITIDVPPGVGVIDIVVISAWGRRMNTAKSNGGSMDARCSGMSMMRSSEGTPRRRGRKSVCQRGWYRVNGSGRRVGVVGQRG